MATAVLYTRQPMLVAYIILGALLGPFGVGLLNDTALLANTQSGIIFAVFGRLDLPTQNKTCWGNPAHCLGNDDDVFQRWRGYARFEPSTEAAASALGYASSTILGIKLLPTTVLHHRHANRHRLLLVQDLLAIIAILLIGYLGSDQQQPSGITDVGVRPAGSYRRGTGVCRLAILPLLANLTPRIHFFTGNRLVSDHRFASHSWDCPLKSAAS